MSSGASIHASTRCGRHIVALEADEAIFKEVLEPLRRDIPKPDNESKRKRKASTSSADSPYARPGKKIVPTNCLRR